MIQESDITIIETNIKKKLPQWYKKFLLNYPQALIGINDEYNSMTNLYLPNNVKTILEINDPETETDFLTIGIDGCGNFYYTSPSEDTTVYFRDHESEVFFTDASETEVDLIKSATEVYDTIDDLVAYFLELHEEGLF